MFFNRDENIYAFSAEDVKIICKSRVRTLLHNTQHNQMDKYLWCMGMYVAAIGFVFVVVVFCAMLYFHAPRHSPAIQF